VFTDDLPSKIRGQLQADFSYRSSSSTPY